MIVENLGENMETSSSEKLCHKELRAFQSNPSSVLVHGHCPKLGPNPRILRTSDPGRVFPTAKFGLTGENKKPRKCASRERPKKGKGTHPKPRVEREKGRKACRNQERRKGARKSKKCGGRPGKAVGLSCHHKSPSAVMSRTPPHCQGESAGSPRRRPVVPA